LKEKVSKKNLAAYAAPACRLSSDPVTVARLLSRDGVKLTTDRLPRSSQANAGVMDMKPRPLPDELLELRLDPEQRLCPLYDSTCIDLYEAPSEEMGVRVVDNCCEDNIK